MPTPPFSANLQDQLTDPTAWKFSSELGPVFTPRFFCCVSPNTLGITGGKEPVAVIELAANPAFEGETVNYSGTDSYDPDGSITAYAWLFEGHTPASGTASSGTLNYASAGTYTIQLIVTDGTSLDSSPARVELEVKPPLFEGYLATSAGVFYGTGGVTWTGKNSGLSGDDLIVYDVKIDPVTQDNPEANKTVWRCGRGGIQVSRDGGATWTEKNPTSVANTWSDSPAPAISDLTFRQLLFAGSQLYVIATWQEGGGDWRSTLYYTDNAPDVLSDAAATVTWVEVTL